MVIDPTLKYCTCGASFRPGTFHKIWMLLFNEYTYRCPQCGTILTFRFYGHVVKIKTEQIKNKEKLWKRG